MVASEKSLEGLDREALAGRSAGAREWGQIRDGNDGGGWRQYLDGEPIHCGAVLELQELECRSDDYGEYTVRKATGIVVCYEVAWVHGARVGMLHLPIGGHEFSKPIDSWMRFRWARRTP